MKNQTLMAIAAALVLLLGVQAYMLFRLKDRVNALKQQNESSSLAPPGFPGLPQPLLPKNFPDDEAFPGRNWNPYAEMQHMQEEMEKMFGESFSRFHMKTPLGSLSRTPDVDLQEQAEQYVVTVNAPGADQSAINVKLEGQVLLISLKTEQGKDEDAKDNAYRYRERFVGEFQRVLSLPGPVESAKMHTDYRNGVLKISIPKQKHERVRS